MPERQTDPPPERMVRQQPRPDHTVSLFTELVSRESARYQAIANIKRGTIYATTRGAEQRIIDAYPTLYFCREQAPLGSNVVNSMQTSQWVILTWATDLDSENTYNATVDYLGDAIANPAYTRISTVRRAVYDITPTVALGTPLTALLAIKVTAAGTGYTTATVAIGAPGSGATAEAVINASGGISEIIVTNEGSGYTSAPTITITGTGTGAAATGIIQIQTAILTAQKKQELPDNDPLAAEFVLVTKVFEVLPGPLLPFTRWEDLLGPIQGTRQAVVWASQAPSLTATGKITYEARDGSSYVAWKLTETYSNGTGSAGNPAYPITVDDFHDPERGAVQRTTQLVVKTGSEVGSSVHAGGVITKTEYQAFNEFLLKRIIETWAVPRSLLGQEYDETYDVKLPYTLRREAAGTSLGTNRAEVTPMGDGSDRTKIIDFAAISAVLDAYSLSYPEITDLQLPDVLDSISVEWEKSEGVGEGEDIGASSGAGSSGVTLGISSSIDAQGSAAIMPELIITYTEGNRYGADVTDYYFFMLSPVSKAQVVARVAALAGVALSAWPTFRPKGHTLVLKGQKVSVMAKSSYRYSESNGSGGVSSSYSKGHSNSQDYGSSIRAVSIRPTIHGLINLTGLTTDTADAEADTHSEHTGGADGSIDDDGAAAAVATGSVTPTSLAATSGSTSIPTSGTYLYKVDPSIYKYGYVAFRARVVTLS